MAATAKFSWNQAALNNVQNQITLGLKKLGDAVATKEAQLAPYDSGTLVTSIRVIEEGKSKVIIKAGGGSVPYAYRRNFENKLHPNTKHYAENALVNTVRGGITEYFKVGDKA